MNTTQVSWGGLDALHVTTRNPRAVIVLMHGYSMRPEDLAPFAHSLGVEAAFYFPQGPETSPDGARAWWPIDEERRVAQIAVGPRDLFEEFPPHRPLARASLGRFLAELRARHSLLPIVLGGFSQGGMLACDAVLCGAEDVAALVMLSSSRIAFEDWRRQRARLAQLPVFVSHGTQDADLSFDAGENLCEFFRTNGALLTFQSFDGGHEIPLVVWRSLRRFLSELLRERT